jgi:histidinol-phosphatase (PHP family)
MIHFAEKYVIIFLIHCDREVLFMLTDMHNHTFSSFDGKQSVYDVCAAAEKAGVGIIAVAEHFDCDDRGGMLHFPSHFNKWLEETEDAKKKYEGKVQLLRGVEVGQPHIFPKEAAQIINATQYDLVIGSMHDLKGGRDIYFIDIEDTDAFFEEYFSEMLEMISTGVFNILGHIDYPVRVLQKQLNGDPSLKRWESLIVPCLKSIIDKGIALEFSTVLLRNWAGCFGIEPWLLEKYKQLGGEMITLGSDGHVPSLTCFGIERASEVLKEYGFDKTTVFVNRKPQFIHI